MPRNDLADLLGDGDGAGYLVRKVRPLAGNVSVSREGESVLVKIGNVDLIRLTYKTAIAEGQRFMMAAWKNRMMIDPKHRRAPLQIGNMKQRLWFRCVDAVKIGHWMVMRGTEAKFLASDTKRVFVER